MTQERTDRWPEQVAPKAPVELEASTTLTVAQQRQAQRHQEIHDLLAQGLGLRTIARRLGMSRNTVRRYARQTIHSPPVRRSRSSGLLPYLQDLLRHPLEESGKRRLNATQIWRELKAQGYPGSERTVRAHLQLYRRHFPARGEAARELATTFATPSPRQAKTWLLRPPEQLETGQREFLDLLMQTHPEVAHAQRLAQHFQQLVREQRAPELDGWIEAARQGEASDLGRFAANLRRDEAAVRAALCLPWSNGPVEGKINKLKLIKRQMYGRAGFDLLRQSVLYAA